MRVQIIVDSEGAASGPSMTTSTDGASTAAPTDTLRLDGGQPSRDLLAAISAAGGGMNGHGTARVNGSADHPVDAGAAPA